MNKLLSCRYNMDTNRVEARFEDGTTPVSYTHLDVYKRQVQSSSYISVWNTNGSCFSQLASLWVPPGTRRLVR